MRIISMAAALATALLLPCVAQAVAFTNGGFEMGPDPGSFTTYSAGATAITGWRVDSGSVDYIGTYWTPSEGSRSLDMTGFNAGSISQTFDTVAATPYRVDFYLAGNPEGGDAIKSLTVGATGNASETQTFDITGRTRSAMGWSLRSYAFVATGASTTLSFTSNNGGFNGPALDNVSVTALAVPEPATWAMMIGGTGMIGGSLRRRRRVGAAVLA